MLACSLLKVLPLGPSSFPTKLNYRNSTTLNQCVNESLKSKNEKREEKRAVKERETKKLLLKTSNPTKHDLVLANQHFLWSYGYQYDKVLC